MYHPLVHQSLTQRLLVHYPFEAHPLAPLLLVLHPNFCSQKLYNGSSVGNPNLSVLFAHLVQGVKDDTFWRSVAFYGLLLLSVSDSSNG